MASKKVRTTVYLKEDNYEKFKAYSEKTMIPMSRMIDLMIQKYLEKKENK